MSTERDGGLDDLFASADEPIPDLPPEEKPRSRAGWVIRNVLLVAVATVVTIAGLRSAGIGVSVLLVVAAFVALRLLMLAVAEVAPPLPPVRPRQRRLTDAAEHDYHFGGTDMLRAVVRRWEQRLDWSRSDPDRFSSSLLPVLAELTDERLRLRHGITRASDPRRARELIGDQLWQLLNEPGRRPPKPRDMEAHVETLERL